MLNEQKVCCGGFFIGDGLEMDGKTLKALGGGSEGGYTYYPVSITYSSVTGAVSIPQPFSEMLENIKNKKIPVLYDGYDVWHLLAWDDWTLEFTYAYAHSTGATTKTIYYETDDLYVDSHSLEAGFSAKFQKSGTNWTFTGIYTDVARMINLKSPYRIWYQLANNQPIYYLNIVAFRPTEGYATFGCNYPTDTGIHFDYFKLKSDETVEYTSKDITI